MECRHYLVSGLVQGVYFRVATQAKAKQLGITGWVRNKLDGRVEVLACNAESKIMTEFEHWLKQGPPAARVDNIETTPQASQPCSDFAIRKTV